MPTSLDHTLTALAEPTRRAVVDLLRVRPRPSGELASALHMSAPAMSRHLRVLRLKGLVEEEHTRHEDARLRIYRLRPQPFVQLRNWVAEVEALWSDQLANFKTHAESSRKGKRQ
jgi:DNA-binding transcriptional ArsR family regulator